MHTQDWLLLIYYTLFLFFLYNLYNKPQPYFKSQSISATLLWLRKFSLLSQVGLLLSGLCLVYSCWFLRDWSGAIVGHTILHHIWIVNGTSFDLHFILGIWLNVFSVRNCFSWWYGVQMIISLLRFDGLDWIGYLAFLKNNFFYQLNFGLSWSFGLLAYYLFDSFVDLEAIF